MTANEAHVVMVMADDSDYPSRVFESLIEAKAFAVEKQERSGTRVYVTSVPLVRAACDGEMADPRAFTALDLKGMVMQDDDGGRCQGCEDALVGMTVVHDADCMEARCPRHGYTPRADICDCDFEKIRQGG